LATVIVFGDDDRAPLGVRCLRAAGSRRADASARRGRHRLETADLISGVVPGGLRAAGAGIGPDDAMPKM